MATLRSSNLTSLAAQLNEDPNWISIVTNNHIGQADRKRMEQDYAARNGFTLPANMEYDPSKQAFVPERHPGLAGLGMGATLLGGGAIAGGLGGLFGAAPSLAPTASTTLTGTGGLIPGLGALGPETSTTLAGTGGLVPGMTKATSSLAPKASTGVGGFLSKLFGKGGIDPTTALLGGLSMFGPNDVNSFKGTTVDPVQQMTKTLDMIDKLSGQISSRGPSHLRSPLSVNGAPQPVTIPGIPFQIGGGFGSDPSIPADPTKKPGGQ